LGCGLKEPLIQWGPDPPWEGAILRGVRAARSKVKGRSSRTCAKTAEPIEMVFGLWAWVGSGNYVLDGGSYPPTPRGNS